MSLKQPECPRCKSHNTASLSDEYFGQDEYVCKQCGKVFVVKEVKK